METVLIAIGALVPMLLVLVVVHELGHFVTARALGVKVLEFGVGFPPRAFGLYAGRTRVLLDPATTFINLRGETDLRRGQLVKVSSAEDSYGNLVARTIEGPPARRRLRDRFSRDHAVEEPRLVGEDLLRHEGKVHAVEAGAIILADMLYSINWAPLGGFVRLAGESNPEVPRSLAGKGVGTRFLVLVAGPLMNAILPIAIFTVLLMIPQDVTIGRVAVSEVLPNSAAAETGIRSGDVIVLANGDRIENQLDLIRAINLNGGATMELLLLRGGQETVVRVKPQFDSSQERWLVGVLPRLDEARVVSRSEPLWKAFPESFVSTWELLVLVKQALFGAFSEGSAPQFSGPIGIAQLTGEVTRDGGLTGWLAISVLLSINLAILNILPIPMLDGGRLVFVVLEWLRRGKRVPPEKEGLVHLIGFVVLIGAILVISANDINRLIQGQSFLGGG
jgi:regulator of sigma E protease